MSLSREIGLAGGSNQTEDAVDGRESWNPRWKWFVLAGIGLATLVAFRTVLIAPFGLFDPAEFEYWFFIPTRDSGALSVLVACWFLWNRKEQLASAPAPRLGWQHWAAAILVVLFFLWAVWMRVQAQLIPALCLSMAILAAAWGGRSGLRLVAMPCAALLLALPPPSPIQAEIIWRLQGLTASGADLLLRLAGYSVQLEGTEIRFGGHAFVIIEACSGWRGIQVLSLVGLLATELRGLPLRRAIWVVVAAVPLGIVLNIIRACLVMLTNETMEAEFFDSHTPQGIAVLMVGSLVLYGLAVLLQRDDFRGSGGVGRGDVDMTSSEEQGPRVVRSERRFAPWAVFSLSFALALALISVLFPTVRDSLRRPVPHVFNFPRNFAPWSGTPLGLDYFFPYSTATNPQFHMEYRDPDAPGGGDLVDFFIAREIPMPAGLDRMPDAKLLLPASDWTLVSREPAQVWQLGIDAEKAILSREAGSKLTYVVAWRLHDTGLIRESLRSFLGLQGCDREHSDCARIVVRIAVPIMHDDDDGRSRAARTVKRFIDRFVLPLKVLERR